MAMATEHLLPTTRMALVLSFPPLGLLTMAWTELTVATRSTSPSLDVSAFHKDQDAKNFLISRWKENQTWDFLERLVSLCTIKVYFIKSLFLH